MSSPWSGGHDGAGGGAGAGEGPLVTDSGCSNPESAPLDSHPGPVVHVVGLLVSGVVGGRPAVEGKLEQIRSWLKELGLNLPDMFVMKMSISRADLW